MDWVIGDIHGMSYTLQSLINNVREKDSDAHLVFVGDYADRGWRSKEVVDILLGLDCRTTFLRGNHDDVIDFLANGVCECVDGIKECIYGAVESGNVCRWWMQNGFATTLASYGIQDTVVKEHSHSEIAEMFRRIIPQEHKRFYRSLRMYWESGTHFACHGYYDPTEELPRELRFTKRAKYFETLWERFSGQEQPVWDKIGVFGHTPFPSAVFSGNLRLIDTGSFLGNAITAYCCNSDSYMMEQCDSRDFDTIVVL